MTKDLERLARLAAMIRETELSRLAALAAERRRIGSDMADLRARMSETARRPGLDGARRAGADAQWQKWCWLEMAALSQGAARIAADEAAQIPAARRAFGRAEALSSLVHRNRAKR